MARIISGKYAHFGEMLRVIGELTNTDRIMNDAFRIGVYPEMTEGKLIIW